MRGLIYSSPGKGDVTATLKDVSELTDTGTVRYDVTLLTPDDLHLFNGERIATYTTSWAHIR